MKYINFIVGAISWVPYFVPLVIEGNKRGMVSHFFLRKNPKEYADPYNKHNMLKLKKITNKHNILIKNIKEVINFPGLTFLMEADISGRSQRDYSTAGILYLNSTHLKVSFTFNADFIWQFHRYRKSVDYIVFPGKSYAEAYGKISPQNLYLGSPKFDVDLNSDYIYKKYKLSPKSKYLLFFYPKGKWINNSPKLHRHFDKMRSMISVFQKMGFRVIVKSREKDHLTQSLGDHYFEEKDLFPNSSLELLHISSLAVFFSSATIEECVMMSTPFIDFKVDHKFDRFAFLHHPAYSRIIGNLTITINDLTKHVKAIMQNDNSEIFREMQLKHMFLNENVSAKILDHFTNEADNKYNDAIQIYSQIKELRKKQSKIEKKRTENVDPILEKIKMDELKENKNN